MSDLEYFQDLLRGAIDPTLKAFYAAKIRECNNGVFNEGSYSQGPVRS